MKTFVLIVSAMLVFAGSEFSATTISYRKTTEGANMTWNGTVVVPCFSEPKDCLRTPPPPKAATILPYGSGYLLTTTVDDMEAWHVDHPEDLRVQTAANHTFDEYTELRIDECLEFPSLVSVTINLGGMSTNSSKVLTIYIP